MLCPCGCLCSLLTHPTQFLCMKKQNWETLLEDHQLDLPTALPTASKHEPQKARPGAHRGVVHTAVQAQASVRIEGLWVHPSTLRLQCPQTVCGFSYPYPGPSIQTGVVGTATHTHTIPIVYTGTVIHTLYLDNARGSTKGWSHNQPWFLGVQRSTVASEGNCLGRQGRS